MASKAGGWQGASNNMGVLTKRATQLVSYYHWSYEDFIGKIFRDPMKFQSAYTEFSDALKNSGSAIKVIDVKKYLMDVAKASVSRAPKAAQSAIKFFPDIPKDLDLTTFDPKMFMDGAFWDEVEKKAEKNSKFRQGYFNSVRESFELFGTSVRSIVKTELE